MKTALFSLFLLFSLLLSATAKDVVDTDGDLLRNGGSYYIVSAIRGAGGGGVGLVETGNETCPLSVVQFGSDLNRGLPVRLESPLRIPYIHTGLALNLGFTTVPNCAATPSQWTVVDLDGSKFVKITGYDNPVLGSFKIERGTFGFTSYRLVFSPRRGVTSGNVVRGEFRHLVVTDEKDYVFNVVFIKARSSAA